jgi:hypothetical protein
MMKARMLGLLLLILPFAIQAQNLLPYIPQVEQNIIVTQTVNEISSHSIQPTEEEFPLWAKDLQRAEIITFGSFPFTMLFSSIAMDLYVWGTNNWVQGYSPIFNPMEMTIEQRFMTIGIALGASILIAVADNIIVQVKRSNEAKKAAALPPGEPIIIRRPIDDQEEDEGGESSDSGSLK